MELGDIHGHGGAGFGLAWVLRQRSLGRGWQAAHRHQLSQEVAKFTPSSSGALADGATCLFVVLVGCPCSLCSPGCFVS